MKAPGSWILLGTILICGSPAASEEPAAGTVSDGPVEGMVFAWIPSGGFLMGSRIYGPQHEVTIQGFEMMTTEVTQAVWEEVMGTVPSFFYTGADSDFARPVESVSWEHCRAFADSLSAIDSTHVYRLPSEAEWEYACRAGASTIFFWGGAMEGEFCWFADNSGSTTHRVGGRLPNEWGLYDMVGNVDEWCEDAYWSNYEGAASDGSPRSGDAEHVYHVIRGGNWGSTAGSCTSASRGYCVSLGGKSSYTGFRLVRTDTPGRPSAQE